MKVHLFLLAALLTFSACAKKVEHSVSSEPATPAVIATVYFAVNSATLTQTASTQLDQAAINLHKQASLTVEVAGHTDSRGPDAYNVELSKRRASSVNNYLLKKGITAGRLNIIAYGESRPAASNDTEAGMAKNRRVELKTQ